MANEQSGLRELIYAGSEDRHREYKEAKAWDDPGDSPSERKAWKAKITKEIIALANIADGGAVVVGVEGLTFAPVGLSEAQAHTWKHDLIADYVREYADPYVRFTVDCHEADGLTFAVIRVLPFDGLPVICKRDGPGLEQGRIYTRTAGAKPEAAPVRSQTEMREILDRASAHLMRQRLTWMASAGIALPGAAESPVSGFDDQLGGL